jgi:hypothetical protein
VAGEGDDLVVFAIRIVGYPMSQIGRRSGGDAGIGATTQPRRRHTLPQQAKRGAQDALFTAIRDQAETNMKSALRAPEKARLLRELAEAYRLTAGGSVPIPVRDGKPADDTAGNTPSADGGARQSSAR